MGGWVLAAETDDLTSISGTPVMEGETDAYTLTSDLYMHAVTCVHLY